LEVELKKKLDLSTYSADPDIKFKDVLADM
jgi:hypothetical protein